MTIWFTCDGHIFSGTRSCRVESIFSSQWGIAQCELCTCVVITAPPRFLVVPWMLPMQVLVSCFVLRFPQAPAVQRLFSSPSTIQRSPPCSWFNKDWMTVTCSEIKRNLKFSQYIRNAVLGHMQQIMIDKAYITSHMNLTSICKRTYSINIILCNANRSLLCFHEMCLWDRVLKDSVFVIQPEGPARWEC